MYNIRLDNLQKEASLSSSNQLCKERLAECRSDLPLFSNDINDTILRGDVIVKIIRNTTGKELGPGTYELEKIDKSKLKGTHNIKGNKQFQDLSMIGSRKQSANKSRDKETARLVSSFYETSKTSLSNIFKEAEKCSQALISPHKSSILKLSNQCRSAPSAKQFRPLLNESENFTCNQTITTTNESKDTICMGSIKELDISPKGRPWSQEKGCAPILIEYSRLARTERENIRKDVVTPEFQNVISSCEELHL